MAQNVQPDYHFHLKTASSPAISPDGNSVAFAVHRFDQSTDEAKTDVFVTDLSGTSALTQLTDSGKTSNPSFAPDGKAISYLDEDESGVKQVFTRPKNGGDAIAITSQIAEVDAFAWSPDGMRLAFRSLVPSVDELEAINADPSKPVIRTARRIRYRQDGIGWRGDSFYQLFVLDTSSNEVAQIASGDGDVGPPVWSPDGTKIAFISDANDERETSSKTELFVWDSESASNTQWSGSMFMTESIAWSPDSSQIAVTGGRDKSEVGGYGLTTQSSIYILGPGSEPVKLTDDSIRPHANGGGFPVTANSPFMTWTTDNRIVFGADSRGQSHICVLEPDAPGNVQRITDGWQITEIVTNTEANLAVVAASSPTSHGELYLVDLSLNSVRAVTSLNKDFFANHNLPTLEKFSITRGEFEIESRVWFPPGFDPSKKYPLLLDVHGGPHSAFYDSFYPIHQVGAGAGYVVVAPNPRGSSSYGLDFATAVHGDWGIGDFDDVMAAMEHVAARDYVDETRVVIHGSSYGGFMSSWAVGHTERFNAAVIAAPVTNLSSFYGTSDIGVNFSETQLGGERFETIDEYNFHSPLTYARNVNTPVLLLHGEDDTRVPIEQSEQYFIALKRHGKNVEFVRLPGTSHGIFRAKHPIIRKEYFRRMLDWCERYNS